MSKTPGVGIALLIRHQQRILIGCRNKAPMQGSWQLPGGWLRYGETATHTIDRLSAGFPGMRLTHPAFVAVTDNHFADGFHSISLYYRSGCLNGDEIDLQLNPSCSDWYWADWYDLPDSLFLPLAELRDSGFVP